MNGSVPYDANTQAAPEASMSASPVMQNGYGDKHEMIAPPSH